VGLFSKVRADARRQQAVAAAPLAETLTLEQLVTGAEHAALDASPLQRAICRLATGEPLDGVLNDSELNEYLGTRELGTLLPTLIVLVAGVAARASLPRAPRSTHA
jgi:hypothetical protein